MFVKYLRLHSSRLWLWQFLACWSRCRKSSDTEMYFTLGSDEYKAQRLRVFKPHNSLKKPHCYYCLFLISYRQRSFWCHILGWLNSGICVPMTDMSSPNWHKGMKAESERFPSSLTSWAGWLIWSASLESWAGVTSCEVGDTNLRRKDIVTDLMKTIPQHIDKS